MIEQQHIADLVYMKIDVEGFEPDILKGAERLLGSNLLAILSEVAFLPTRARPSG